MLGTVGNCGGVLFPAFLAGASNNRSQLMPASFAQVVRPVALAATVRLTARSVMSRSAVVRIHQRPADGTASPEYPPGLAKKCMSPCPVSARPVQTARGHELVCHAESVEGLRGTSGLRYGSARTSVPQVPGAPGQYSSGSAGMSVGSPPQSLRIRVGAEGPAGTRCG